MVSLLIISPIDKGKLIMIITILNYISFFLAGTPKPISRSASPHIPINSNSTTLSQAAATVAAKVELSSSSSSSSSSGR
jgi:hypothetical protein